MGTLFVSDYIPFMGWIDKLRGLHARLRTFKEMDDFYHEVIDEHMEYSHKKTPEEEDIVDVLLQLKKHHSFFIDLTNDKISSVNGLNLRSFEFNSFPLLQFAEKEMKNVLLGATDTTAATTVDPEAWKDPEEFVPESSRMVFVTLDIGLANLLHSFDWEFPEGMKREDFKCISLVEKEEVDKAEEVVRRVEIVKSVAYRPIVGLYYDAHHDPVDH
ncbi:unnamed protein product [Sphenostylis stenocarpa]|uniref:Uncharacterized protein n=1 Tax=Sphenostylis stenocarpa TaxID=92480 RepID=A0AA86SAJ3_9FABA|nr:unnamed protein product [Sphenostylis stenocarpa]